MGIYGVSKTASNESESRDWRNSRANDFFQSPFEWGEWNVLNKFALVANQKQPLKCVPQNSYLDLLLNTLSDKEFIFS